jgi:hypothetical protein
LTTCGNTSPPFYAVRIAPVLEKRMASEEEDTLFWRPITITHMITSLYSLRDLSRSIVSKIEELEFSSTLAPMHGTVKLFLN